MRIEDEDEDEDENEDEDEDEDEKGGTLDLGQFDLGPIRQANRGLY